MEYRFSDFCRFRLFAAFSVLAFLVSGCSLSRQTSSSSANFQSAGTGESPRSPHAVKIYTTQEGIYELSRTDLEKEGFETQGSQTSKLMLFNLGQQVPLWFGGEKAGDLSDPGSIYFYASPSSSRFTSENVYWLVQGASPEIESPWMVKPTQDEVVQFHKLLTTTETLAPDTYFATTRLEQNLLYTPQVEKGDHWLWLSMAAPGSQSVDTTLKNLAAGPGRIRVGLWARTEAPADPEPVFPEAAGSRSLP